MSTTTFSTSDNHNGGGALLLLLAFLVVGGLGLFFLMAEGSLQASPPAQENADLLAVWNGSLDLPLSKHAATRAKDDLTPEEIRTQIRNGLCKPVKAFLCVPPGNTHAKVLCPLKGDFWAGLIVGLEGNSPVIVTGYPSTRQYWEGTLVRDACTPIAIVP